MSLLTDSHVWFVISFLVFLGVAWKLGRGAVLAVLDGKIEAIKKDIETAENLRVEAQELLAQYQRKQRDALKDAEEIIENARKHSEENRKAAEAELEETMARREQQLKERLVRMEQAAIQEIKSYAAELALSATTQIITDKLDKKTNEKLVDQAIKDVGNNIH